MKEHKHPPSIALFLPLELCSENCREAAHDYRVIVPRDTAAKRVCVLVMRAKEWERQYLYSNTLVSNCDISRIPLSAFILRR